MAISLHQQSTIDNAALAKRRAKCKHRLPWRMTGSNSAVKVVGIVSPDEVIKALEAEGITMNRKTLTRWEQAGLIPIPERGGRGQGLGSYTEYPGEVVTEATTIYTLKQEYGYKQRNNELACARQRILAAEQGLTIKNYLEYLTASRFAADATKEVKAFSVEVVLENERWVPKIKVTDYN